jgi:hypothetical protein
MSLNFTARAAFAVTPFASIRLSSQAFDASPRVLKNRAAQSHLSIRTESIPSFSYKILQTSPYTSAMSTQPSLPPATYAVATSTAQAVVITDINISIGAMCRFMIKWVIAAIPAAIIIWAFLFLVGILVAAVFGGIIHTLLGAPQVHF